MWSRRTLAAITQPGSFTIECVQEDGHSVLFGLGGLVGRNALGAREGRGGGRGEGGGGGRGGEGGGGGGGGGGGEGREGAVTSSPAPWPECRGRSETRPDRHGRPDHPRRGMPTRLPSPLGRRHRNDDPSLNPFLQCVWRATGKGSRFKCS